MTRDDTELASADQFREELKTLLRQAADNDVEVRGGWECFNGDTHPDWDVVVTEVETVDDS